MTIAKSLHTCRAAVVQFPGSNCDQDVIFGLKNKMNIAVDTLWHTETILPRNCDAVVLPGGFSFGDYLRGGCLAAHSPIMHAVRSYVGKGGAVIGICNGFQVLTESQLLPGALLKNHRRKFICKTVSLKPEEGGSDIHRYFSDQDPLQIPIAHGEGRYFLAGEDLNRLKERGGILFRYCDGNGEVNEEINPNGSVDNIAGIVSENGRVLGMMPHPERALDRQIGGSNQGLKVWKAFFNAVM